MKKHLMMGTVALLLAVLALFPTGQVALADEISCRGSLGAITVDNLKVPSGATCTLTGTRVQETIVVESRAILRASGIRVVGNIQAEGARAVNVTTNSTVGGSIQIKQGGSARIATTRITGDLQFDANRAAISATGNTIGGSLQAFQNTGGLTITRNRINGNLQCKENQPAPTGSGNIVQGSKEDQCARL
jgi:hypothetical protein